MSSFLGLAMIVRRSLRQHALSTCVTVASVALGSGLVMAVFSVSAQSSRAFGGGAVGFDAVLGARGSQLQLVLNTVFHLETSPGNIPWELYTSMRDDPRVRLALPYAVGDNYRSFRIVGTTEEIFDAFEYRKGESFTFEPGGRAFDPLRREAVIGSTVARETGLQRGSEFSPNHGVAEGKHDHDEHYLVVGVLEPTSSPSDRVIWIPIDGVFRMGGHVLRATGERFEAQPGEAIPDEHKEVSAVILDFRTAQAGFMLDQMINKSGKEATLAWPIANVMADLFKKLGWVNRILELVAYLVVVLAAGSILASIYNTMNERRREFAILRSLGARRSSVFTVIVLEATTIAAMGSVLGYLVYGAILAVSTTIVRRETGVELDAGMFHPTLLWTPAGMIGLGAVSGLLPALKAYATDVAANLVPTS